MSRNAPSLSNTAALSILDAMPLAVIVMDHGGTMHYASPVVPEVLGYSVPETLELNGLDLVHPADAQLALASMDIASRATGPFAAQMLRLRHASGDWVRVWVSTRGTTTVGEVPGLVFTVENENTNLRLLSIFRSLAGGATWEQVCAEIVQAHTVGRQSWTSIHYGEDTFDQIIATTALASERLGVLDQQISNLPWAKSVGQGWYPMDKLPEPVQELCTDTHIEAIKVSPVVLFDGQQVASVVHWHDEISTMGAPIVEMQEADRVQLLRVFTERRNALTVS